MPWVILDFLHNWELSDWSDDKIIAKAKETIEFLKKEDMEYGSFGMDRIDPKIVVLVDTTLQFNKIKDFVIKRLGANPMMIHLFLVIFCINGKEQLEVIEDSLEGLPYMHEK